MRKPVLATLCVALASALALSSCMKGKSSRSPEARAGSPRKLSVVCTNFPCYDFARQVVGQEAEVRMLLRPGAESHSYEPSPSDIITIQNCDLFVFVGGDSDEWVGDILSSMDLSHMALFKLMDQVQTVEEELSEGMESEEDDDEAEVEMDEHVWTSPSNAMTIVENLAEVIASLDPEHARAYQRNAASYIARIQKVDDDFHKVVAEGKRREIIVADRFPFRYFCDEFGLSYYAAFPGCSTKVQPSAKTVVFLTRKVEEEGIPVVFYIELSNERMADAVAESTGVRTMLLHAVHNVSDSDFQSGASYVSLMEGNVVALREALN
ncbi:MAG: metal ABC transporter substrate-binding protein [Sphaerochaetaceae bacterium]|nr:metal ABC transporter substrate-binding protein [Spirochaetales bacterium]MDY5500469.1 metal ABC transporter substrate-binding protein [Sphaerochaetaceae bacterium]